MDDIMAELLSGLLSENLIGFFVADKNALFGSVIATVTNMQSKEGNPNVEIKVSFDGGNFLFSAWRLDGNDGKIEFNIL